VISDVSRGRELRLPWDYKTQLGLDPDTQPVADGRARFSIPFFFRSLHLRADRGSTAGTGYVLGTDGGMLSNYPIDIFDGVNNPLAHPRRQALSQGANQPSPLGAQRQCDRPRLLPDIDHDERA
jgi:hypothetical protein